MENFLIYTIVGLSLSAIYAVIASGLVLTYTTTGIFNFAHGAVGMLAAFAYWQLRVDWGWPAPVALIVVVFLLAPALGWVLERFIMRGLTGTSEATRLVVSISLLLGMIGLANVIWKPAVSRPLRQFFQGQKIDLGVTSITYQQAITVAVAVAVAVALRFLLYRTRIGVSMRANVDDRTLTVLNGARPTRIAGLSWAIGSALAAVGGILIAPPSLEAGTLSLVIINAYAAAIFGRLRSLPLTFVGAIVIGLSEGYVTGYVPGTNVYFAGFRPAVAVIILFLVLLFVPNTRVRSRVQIRESFPSPSVSGMVLLAGFVATAGVVMATTLDTTDQIAYGRIFPLAIVALSLVPLLGFAGQISLAQLSFAGVGAIAAAHHGGGGSPLGLVLAMVFAALVGAVVALPVLRLSGIYLALATAAFAVALDRWIFILPDFDIGPIHVSLFGFGSTDVDPMRLFGYTFDSPGSQLVLSSVAFALVAMAVAALRWSRFGRQLVAMRDSEMACATFGLNPLWPRLGVFMFSAAVAGLGGALYGMQLGTVAPARFDLLTGLPIFVLVVVGGAGLVGGALFAGVSLFGILPVISTLGPFVEKLNTVTPGAVGVGLGRSPSGAVPLMSEAVAPLRRDRPAMVAMMAAMAGAYVLRMLDVIGNWPLVLLVVAAFVLANETAKRRAAVAARRGSDPVPAIEDLEWVGVTRPFTSAHLSSIDQALGLDGLAPALPTIPVAAGAKMTAP